MRRVRRDELRLRGRRCRSGHQHKVIAARQRRQHCNTADHTLNVAQMGTLRSNCRRPQP